MISFCRNCMPILRAVVCAATDLRSILSPFSFNDSIHKTPHTDSTFGWNLMTHVLPEFHLVMSFSVFERPHNIKGLRSDDCGERSMTVRTPWSSLKMFFEKLWGGFGVTIVLHYEFSTKMQCLWKIKCYFSSLSVGSQLQSVQNTPRLRYSHHHVSLSLSLFFLISLHTPFWYCHKS